MEYIQMKPNNIDVYVNEFHTCIKSEFEKSINKMYKEEINVYRDFIEIIVKLPFIQLIIEENKTLKAKLHLLECNNDNNNNNNYVKLEIIDKYVSKTVLDIENIQFDTLNGAKDESSTDDNDTESSSDDDDDDKDDEDEDEDEDEDNGISGITVKTTNKVVEEYVTPKEEQCIEKEEDFGMNNKQIESLIKKDADQTADEVDDEVDDEEEDEADDENKSPTFPIIKFNKLDGNNNLEEVNVEPVAEEEPSVDQEEMETETEEEPSVDQEEMETETEEEPSVDQEEPSVDQEEPSVDQEEPSVDQEEPSVDQEESEVIEIEIDGVTYYCDDEENGNIYEDDNGEVGNIVGEIKDGEALFFE